MIDLETIVRRDLARLGELGAKHILVACSGGPDSVALLDLLHCLAGTGVFRLSAASLDHGLRPEAGAEVALVGRLAGERGLDFYPGKADPASFPVPGQAGARAARLEFLERTRVKAGADLIALGHTADDQVETVLMNLIRGSGLTGLSGMAWRSGRLIRPLLGAERPAVMAYLARRSLAFVSDPSNRDPAYLRVRVRERFLPLLEGENPAIRRTLARLADALGQEDRLLESLAQARLESLSREMEGALSLDRPGLAALGPALGRRVVRAALGRVKGSLRRIGRDHLELAWSLAEGPGGRADLPGGMMVLASGLEMIVAGASAPALAPLEPLTVGSPGEYRLSTGQTLLVERLIPPLSVDPDPFSALLDEEAFVWPLLVRPPRPGDRISPLGMSGTKKLSDLMIDRKIPRPFRPRVAVVESRGGVLWVAGAALSREAGLTGRSRSALRLMIKPK